MPKRTPSYFVRVVGSVRVGMSADFGGAHILVRTSCGRVSGSLAQSVSADESEMIDLLVHINSTAGSFNTLLLGFGHFEDVAVHRVVNDCNLWSHGDG
jgi:hypothetical protein